MRRNLNTLPKGIRFRIIKVYHPHPRGNLSLFEGLTCTTLGVAVRLNKPIFYVDGYWQDFLIEDAEVENLDDPDWNY